MMRTLFFGLATATLLGAELLHAQAAQRVSFRFSWKPGTVAEVTSVTAMSGMNPAAPGDTASTIIRSATRRTIDAHPRGLLVRTTPVERDGAPPTVAAGTAAAAIRAPDASATIVTADGKFVALGDTLQVRRTIDSTLRSMQATIGALPPARRAAIESSLTMESMTGFVKIGWEQATTRLLGRTWTVGEPVSTTFELPFPTIPGKTVKSAVRTTLVSVVPCDDAAPVVQCALLQTVITLDRADMRRTMAEMFAELGIGTDNVAAMVPESSSETVGETLIEVATMLPRRSSSKTINNTKAMGIERRTEVTTITAYTYTSR